MKPTAPSLISILLRKHNDTKNLYPCHNPLFTLHNFTISTLTHALWLVRFITIYKFRVAWVGIPFYWRQYVIYFTTWEYSSIHSLSYYRPRQRWCILPCTIPNPKPLTASSYPQSPPPSSNMAPWIMNIRRLLWHCISGFGFTIV